MSDAVVVRSDRVAGVLNLQRTGHSTAGARLADKFIFCPILVEMFSDPCYP